MVMRNNAFSVPLFQTTLLCASRHLDKVTLGFSIELACDIHGHYTHSAEKEKHSSIIDAALEPEDDLPS